MCAKDFFRGGEMEKLKGYITRKNLRKTIGKDKYDTLIDGAASKFQNSEEYSENTEVKNLISQMQTLKRNIYASKWFEVLGVSMAAVSGYRIEDYPKSQMVTMMGLGVAGSVIAYFVKKHSKITYSMAEEVLAECVDGSGAMEDLQEHGLTEESMSICSKDICNKVVEDQNVLDNYWR